MDKSDFQYWANKRGTTGWEDFECMVAAFAAYDQINEKENKQKI